MNRVIGDLRSLAPMRALPLAEALRVAELQAQRLLEAYKVVRPPVASDVITSLPRVHVVRTELDTAGAWRWTRGRWVILLNWPDSPLRQRFSLAHQFKHILDSTCRELLYPSAFGAAASKIAEQAADHFAGSLLMPEEWLRESLTATPNSQRDLSLLFEVSEPAIRVRLSALGLSDMSEAHTAS